MSDDIKLGSVSINARDYASQGNAVLGIRDSGKSYTATYIAERLLDAGIPFVAFDPIGLWRFLRVGTGNFPGYPVVVAGGEHGDLPLSPESAPEIVRAAMREGVSLVIDLYSMDLSKADWKRIVQKSVAVLLYENKRHGLRHIFIEEAAEFVPQRIGPDQGQVYAEIEKLARMGGNALLGYTLINQRAEEVNKAVLELCDGMFLHRQKGRNSLTALSKWLDIADATGGKEIIKSLPVLPQGDCWAWAAGSASPVHIHIPTKKTFHPDRRATRDAVSPTAKEPVNVSQFVTAMKALLTTKDEPEEPAVNGIEYIQDDSEIARLQEIIADLDGRLSEALQAAQAAQSAAQEAQDRLAQIGRIIGQEMPTVPVPPPLPAPLVIREAAPRRELKAPKPNGHDKAAGLGKAERSILTALAHYPQGRAKTQVALLAGYAVSGGGFNNALGALRSRDYIEGSGEQMSITPRGLKALGPVQPLPRGRALLDHWLNQLGKAERSILESAARSYPRALSKEQLAATAGYEAAGGGFNNALGRLRTLELITRGQQIKANDTLFGR